MGTKGYADQALEIIQDAAASRVSMDELTEGRAMNPPTSYSPPAIRSRSPEERRDLAREMLQRNGYAPTREENGVTIYTRRSFAYLTLASGGKRTAVNPRHVASVDPDDQLDGVDVSMVVYANGEIARVRGSVDDVVAQLEAVA